jgi:hypothetical protein
MGIEKRKIIILCFVQSLCILGWDGCLAVYSFLSKQPYLNIEPLIYLFTPLLLSAGASFAFSLLVPMRVNFIKGILLSIPAILIYFGYYVIRPMVNSPSVEVIPFLCMVIIPATVLALITNGLTIWFGSLFQAKLFKQKDESAS